MSTEARHEPPIVLRSQRVLLVDGGLAARDLVFDCAVAGGLIRAVLEHGSWRGDGEVIDVGSRVVMPSLVDTHTHCNDPGRTHWEGFDHATRAAAAGGIGWLADMPLNSDPVTIDLPALEQKLDAARGRIFVDVSLYAGLVGGDKVQPAELLTALAERTSAFKAFLCDSGLYDLGVEQFPPVNHAVLEAAMPILAAHGRRLLVHAERLESAPEMNDPHDPRSYQDYLASRPVSCEVDAIAEMIALSEKTGCAIHIVHVSAAESIDLLRGARGRGVAVSAETCPHYLYFAAEEVPDRAAAWKCAPPIREAHHRDALWGGLAEGVLNFIASDHSPCPPGLKALATGDLEAAWGGIASLQLMLPIVWTEAQRRGFSVPDISRWLSREPARFLGDEKRTITVGARADLLVWDPEARFVVDGTRLEHRHALTPYEGLELEGQVTRHYLAGDLVWNDGAIAGTPRGVVRV